VSGLDLGLEKIFRLRPRPRPHSFWPWPHAQLASLTSLARTDRAPTVLVSLQPIMSWRWRAWPMNARVTGSTCCRSVVQRIRGFLNDMRYINPRFTYLLTYQFSSVQSWEHCWYWFLPARRYASAGASYGPVSVSVCVCHKSVLFYRKGWTNRAGFGTGASFHLSYTVL